MMTVRSLTLPLFALVAVLAGCSAEAGTSAGAGSVDNVNANLVAEQNVRTDVVKGDFHGHHGHHGPGGGPDFLVHAALRAPINLTAEQRTTIEGLAKANRPSHEKPAGDADGPKKLAAAIRSNSFDSIQPPAFDESAMKTHLANSATTLAKLHDTLTADQRTALVADIEKHASEHEAKAKDGVKDGEGREHGPRPEFGHLGGPEGGPMMHMLEGLDLTQAQKDTIKAKFEAERPAPPSAEQREQMKANFEAMRAEMKTKLESFKADKFDATAFVTPSTKMPRPAFDRKAHTNPMAVISSVLTPEQREKLATRIEQGPMRTNTPREQQNVK